MTNSAKKPAKAKASRDNLDLDLDARLDQATSTLSLDDESPAGDALDQVLARAKKEIDADLPKKSPKKTAPVIEEIADLNPDDESFDLMDDLDGLLDIDELESDVKTIKSDSITSLENQLAAAMDSSVVEDDDLDNLLGGSGFDFDSLLGEADDELTLSEAEMNEDSLMAAVDELLNFGAFEEEIDEPEMDLDELVETAEPEIVLDELADTAEPEIVLDELADTAEPEIVLDELADTAEPEMTIDKFDDLEDSKAIELTVEPEAALDDLVDSVPFEDVLSIDSNDSEIEDFQEEFNDFDDVADIDAPLVEMSASIESFNDDLDEMQQLEGLNDAMENKNDTTAGFNLLDDDAVEKELATSVTKSDDDDWMKQLDGLDAEETKAAASVALAKADDDDDWMKQLDGLETEETEPTASVDLAKADDDDDWMKQLDGLETEETESAASVDLAKADDDDDWMKQLDGLETEETESAASVDLAKADDDDDWMKQLDGLETEETEPTASVDLAKADDDDDWMKQLDGLETEETEPAASVDLAKADDDDDWMKQLDGLDENPTTMDGDSEWTSEFSNLDDHDEDTAKMLMDANHDTAEDTIVDGKFNITDAEPLKQTTPVNSIDEEALVAKAADLAISQVKDELKGEQDHVLSQLRADQDNIESKNKKQFADAESKRKKTAMFGYIALGAGVIGLIGSAGIGWMSYGTKNDTTNLNQSVTVLEEKVNTFLAKNPEKEKEIENIKTSVEQLNQKVDKLAAAQVVVPPVALTPTADATKTSPVSAKSAETTKVNSAVNLLNSKTTPATTTSSAVDTQKIAETEIAPPIDISPVSPTGDADHSTLKTAEPVKLADMVKKPADTAKEKATKSAQDIAKEKVAKLAQEEAAKAAAKAEAELLTQKIAKATAIAKAAAATTTNSKVEDQRKLLQGKADRYVGRTTRGMARSGRDNSITDATKTKVGTKNGAAPVTKEILNTAIKPQKAVPAGKYSVNVISYQQEWYAQSKAAEFKQKGIPVEVAPVDINNYATRYRLKVAGFKSKAEANAYAAKMKKSFNLNEAWVSE